MSGSSTTSTKNNYFLGETAKHNNVELRAVACLVAR
jgi:hypothetical protein